MVRSALWLRATFAFAALMSISDAASADDNVFSANTVMPGCHDFIEKKSNNTYTQGVCAGVIGGIVHLGVNVLFSAPLEVTFGQTMRVVVQYIDSRPARMHEDFRNLALEAVATAWPCKK